MFKREDGFTPPDRLLESMCRQMRQLDKVPGARQAVASLCEGDGGPFANAEVLNTELGAECFRALVEVDHLATMKAIKAAFHGWSVEDFRDIDAGRRNLVWALEKLVFHEENFADAAYILLNFAAAENEVWANNSTKQFCQLFQVMLPGTEATLSRRLEFFETLIERPEIEIKKVLIQAMVRALDTVHFSRSGGPERQGTKKPLKDYHPQTYGEYDQYLTKCLSIYALLIENGDEFLRIFALEKLSAQMIRSFVGYRLLDPIKSFFQRISVLSERVLPIYISGFNMALAFDHKVLKEDTGYLKSVRQFADEIWPSTLSGELELLLLNSETDLFKKKRNRDDEIDFDDKGELTELAQRVAGDEATLRGFLPKIETCGNVRTYIFATLLAAEITDYKNFLIESLDRFKATANYRIDFLRGVISGVSDRDPVFVNSTLHASLSEAKIRQHFVELVSSKALTDGDLSDIISTLKSESYPVENLQFLSYGGVVKSTSAEAFGKFIQQIIEFDRKGGLVAVDLISMYAFGDPSALFGMREILEEVLLDEVTLTALFVRENRNVLRSHHYEVLTKWMLDNSANESNFCERFVERILHISLQTDSSDLSERTIQNLMREILLKHEPAAWKLLADAVLNSGGSKRFRISTLLGNWFDNKDAEDNLIDQIDKNALFDWIRDNASKAPIFVARIAAPLNESKTEWSETFHFLIDNYGDEEDVLGELSANIGSFSWSGSSISYYKMYRKPFAGLQTHPILKVRKWAERGLEFLESHIKDEQRRLDEQKIGIW